MSKPVKIFFTVIHKSQKYPRGAYVARIRGNDSTKYHGQKQASLTEFDSMVCYEMVTLWAEDKAKELDIKIIPSQKKELDRRLELGRSASKVTLLKEEKMTGGHGYYASEEKYLASIEANFRRMGFDKMSHYLTLGLEKLKELKVKAEDFEAKKKEADELLAKSMFDIYQKTGIDMQESIASLEAEKLYLEYIAKL